MLRSRVTRGIDVARLSNAVSRPGIDPRIWVSYGTLLSEPYVETIEGRQDVVVDVLLVPSMQEETARVGTIYAGNGFGFYAPLHEDDEVLVLAPSGDPDEGLVIAQRLWSPADPPPTELASNTEDVTLVVEPEKNLRITVKGGGNVVLAVDTGKLYLGAEEGTEPTAKGQTLKAYLESVQTALASHTHPFTGTVTGAACAGTTTASATLFPTPSDAILSTTTEVK